MDTFNEKSGPQDAPDSLSDRSQNLVERVRAMSKLPMVTRAAEAQFLLEEFAKLMVDVCAQVESHVPYIDEGENG